MDILSEETISVLIDKIFAVPILCAFLADKWSDFRIKKRMIEAIEKSIQY